VQRSAGTALQEASCVGQTEAIVAALFAQSHAGEGTQKSTQRPFWGADRMGKIRDWHWTGGQEIREAELRSNGHRLHHHCARRQSHDPFRVTVYAAGASATNCRL
jgi:hypothetical protein